MAVERRTAAFAGPTGAGTAAVVAATLGVAAAAWLVTIRQADGMDMGVATHLGALPSFAAAWVPMMAAMMLPGAAPALVRRAREDGRAGAAPGFGAAYLAVWAVAGLAVHALDRPHSTSVAGAVTIAAGLYELTPLKRACRRRCREGVGSGWRLGLCCVGSSLGLMAVLAAVGLMSVAWMSVVAVLALGQKLLPARVGVDVPVALAIVALGVVIVVAPSSVPGLVPAM